LQRWRADSPRHDNITNSTDLRALDELAGPGAEIKVSYDMASTRLHAKARLFHRKSGYSTAYVPRT